MSAPLSRRRVTVAALPLKSALWRAVYLHYNRDTQTDTHRWMNSRQGRSSGHTALYNILRWVRVPYIVLRLYVCPPIQEEGDGGSMIIASSPMEGGRSILQQGHTDRHTDG